jgi:hypothetical protein
VSKVVLEIRGEPLPQGGFIAKAVFAPESGLIVGRVLAILVAEETATMRSF